MELKVVSSGGVIAGSSRPVFSPSATEPDVPDPVSGLVVVIPVMVPAPVPGKVCPVAQWTSPLGEMERPVAAGAAVPAPYNNAMLDDGVDVSLPVGITCQAKFCATELEVLLE